MLEGFANIAGMDEPMLRRFLACITDEIELIADEQNGIQHPKISISAARERYDFKRFGILQHLIYNVPGESRQLCHIGSTITAFYPAGNYLAARYEGRPISAEL
ncbi:hypothetical protein [Arboricoccus pini]|uniref:hypothetical protein n=1 Tax=Arboricoccus pini TaxID=1963835 RepID=UPI0013FDEBC7|nr:hypothetical protein [Arboricoccus pini]